ncbi:MAG: hypothetical protein WC516_05210 [Patescibacteria group bacterium]
MNVILCIGCWGRIEEEFCSCSGINNKILDLSKDTDRNIQIANYLDTIYRLFDKPLYNNVHTAVWNIQEKFSEKGKPVFKETLFKRIEDFCIMHAKCGLYLRLELKEK